jgi:hypothetical protein
MSSLSRAGCLYLPRRSSSPNPSSTENESPTSLCEGEGQCGWGCALGSPECCWLSPHPSIEGRGSWSACCMWLSEKRGVEEGRW